MSYSVVEYVMYDVSVAVERLMYVDVVYDVMVVEISEVTVTG